LFFTLKNQISNPILLPFCSLLQYFFINGYDGIPMSSSLRFGDELAEASGGDEARPF